MRTEFLSVHYRVTRIEDPLGNHIDIKYKWSYRNKTRWVKAYEAGSSTPLYTINYYYTSYARVNEIRVPKPQDNATADGSQNVYKIRYADNEDSHLPEPLYESARPKMSDGTTHPIEIVVTGGQPRVKFLVDPSNDVSATGTGSGISLDVSQLKVLPRTSPRFHWDDYPTNIMHSDTVFFRLKQGANETYARLHTRKDGNMEVTGMHTTRYQVDNYFSSSRTVGGNRSDHLYLRTLDRAYADTSGNYQVAILPMIKNDDCIRFEYGGNVYWMKIADPALSANGTGLDLQSVQAEWINGTTAPTDGTYANAVQVRSDNLHRIAEIEFPHECGPQQSAKMTPIG